jgi:hypothetical protein
MRDSELCDAYRKSLTFTFTVHRTQHTRTHARPTRSPAAVEYMMFIGMSSMMRDLIPVMAKNRKTQPSMKTAASACL